MRRLAFTLFVIALMVTSVSMGCGSAGSGRVDGEPVVVTSTTVLADLIRNVLGDRGEVISIVPAGRNPQGYEPTPRDVVTLSKATLIVVNGHFYEPFMDPLIANAGVDAGVVRLSQDLRNIVSVIDHGDHEHVFPNPYLYLNVHFAIAYVERIRDALIAADNRHAETYRRNASGYIAELENLDQWIIEQLAQIPEEQRRVMQDHASLPYYADRYGLVDLAASYEGTQEVQPTPSQYATLLSQIEEYNIQVLFAEDGYSAKLLERLAADTNTRVVSGLHAVTLGTTDGTDSYIEMMQWNTRLFVEHLS